MAADHVLPPRPSILQPALGLHGNSTHPDLTLLVSLCEYVVLNLIILHECQLLPHSAGEEPAAK